ncbi:hydrogenase nickel incorporation protein HypB [Egbenema bharatensis]|uniref:hydrogenase nickel incorporation protein HypB n=1 Tax=Egbenema bharatensis TaxID=3463334 RepID=UPI003A84F20B
MCVTCGCSDDSHPILTNLQTGVMEAIAPAEAPLHDHIHTLPDGSVITHRHDHSAATHAELSHAHPDQPHQHSHSDHHPDPDPDQPSDSVTQLHAALHGSTIELEHKLLAKNDRIAAHNRDWLKQRHILALNLVSSPGAGKTTLLTRTITDLQNQMAIAVIEGDQETANDAQRIQATGCPVVQVNTGTGCHLEAAMIERGLQTLNPPPNSLLMIENVGNLVCPALFNLGEQAKVVILSVTEGEDKPIKYPHMFRASQVMILTKTDLLPYVPFDVDRCLAYARQVNPRMQIFQISALTGDGLADWYAWLQQAQGGS